jgi:hypothetical protein
MDTNALIKISNVVTSYLNETNEGVDEYFRYMQIIIEGASKINATHAHTLKVYFTSVNEVNIAELPADCLKVSKVGIVIDGTIYSLTKNDNIALNDSETCGIQIVSDSNLDSQRMPTTLNYSQGGGFNIATYRVNDRAIIFKGSISDYVVAIEYKSSGISLDGETFVPVIMLDVLKEYLNYTLVKRDKKASQASKYEAKIQFINERRDYIKKKNPFTRFDVLDAINSGKGQGVK